MTEAKEIVDRLRVVERGVTEYTKHRAREIGGVPDAGSHEGVKGVKLEIVDPAKDARVVKLDRDGERATSKPTVARAQFKAAAASATKKYASVKEKIETITIDESIPKIELSEKDKRMLRDLELEHEKRINREASTTPADSSMSVDSDKIAADKPKVEEKLRNEKNTARPTARPRQTVSLLGALSSSVLQLNSLAENLRKSKLHTRFLRNSESLEFFNQSRIICDNSLPIKSQCEALLIYPISTLSILRYHCKRI